MKDQVVILAVTKMLSGFCLGGISLATRKWIRPVKEFGTILIGDIRYRDKTFIRMYDVVEFELIKHRPKPPHIEDWITDFVRVRPRAIGRVQGGKREEFLRRYAEEDFTWLKSPRPNRSLCLNGPIIHPLDVVHVPFALTFSRDEYSGKYEARLEIDSERAYPITDLKWRALGRALVGNGGEVKLDADDLRQELNVREVYVSSGLSRLHEGKYWPLVIGVHTTPDYETEIDYAQP